MSGRPTDWSPLAGSDPIGGDLATVQSEARYYSDLAQEIHDQVGRLRKIASEGEQIGKTADKLRDAASSSADKIDQTHGRVAAVGEALTSWIPHLDNAQTDTLAALTAAKEAVQRQQANAAPPAGSPPPKTDADKSADKARAGRLDAANGDLAAAKKKFDDAVAERDRQADKIAGHIKDALHDGLKDGFWDHISNWVSQHVALIKMVVEVLTWVATAVAIACIFIPGLNLLAIALTIGVLAGHSLLAATGNGSWVDVAIDVGDRERQPGCATGRIRGRVERFGQVHLAEGLPVVPEPQDRNLRRDHRAEGGPGEFGREERDAQPRTARGGQPRVPCQRRQGPRPEHEGHQGAACPLRRRRAVRSSGRRLAANDPAGAGGGRHRPGDRSHQHAITKSEIPGLNQVLRGVPPWEHFKELTTTGDSWAREG